MYLYSSIENGQLMKPALCQLDRHTFVPCTLNMPTANELTSALIDVKLYYYDCMTGRQGCS